MGNVGNPGLSYAVERQGARGKRPALALVPEGGFAVIVRVDHARCAGALTVMPVERQGEGA